MSQQTHTRHKKERKHILDYYLLEKQLKFKDAIQDEMGEESIQEAINIFNDPFGEEKQFDQMNTIDRNQKDIDENAGELITGGYERDIQCLKDDDMIDAPISKNSKINQAVTKILKKNKDADKDTKLLLKF